MAGMNSNRKKDSIKLMLQRCSMDIGSQSYTIQSSLQNLERARSLRKGILRNRVGTNVHLNYLDRIYAKGLVKQINIQEGAGLPICEHHSHQESHSESRWPASRLSAGTC